MIDRHRVRAAVMAAAAGLAVLAACGAPATDQPSTVPVEHQHHEGHEGHEGQEGHEGHTEEQGGAQHHGHGGGLQLWATQTAALGVVALDGAGRIVYRSDADAGAPPASRCAGECAQAWVPLTVADGQEPELLGIDRERVGTLPREDGSLQVTLAGWPLYTRAGDPGAHDDTGAHGADGIWFAVTPTGEKATP